MNVFYDWILNHDDCKIFFVLYIGLSVVLSIVLGLFWLLLVVLLHMALDMIALKGKGETWRQAFLDSFWALKFDFSLVVFALAIAVYMDFVFGFLGVSHGARVSVHAGSRMAHSGTRSAAAGSRAIKAGARMAGWQRALRPILLSIDDAVQFLKAFWRRNVRHVADNPRDASAQEKITPCGSDRKADRITFFSGWTRGDKATLFFAFFCVVFIAVAPLFTEKTFFDVLQIIGSEMKPF